MSHSGVSSSDRASPVAPSYRPAAVSKLPRQLYAHLATHLDVVFVVPRADVVRVYREALEGDRRLLLCESFLASGACHQPQTCLGLHVRTLEHSRRLVPHDRAHASPSVWASRTDLPHPLYVPSVPQPDAGGDAAATAAAVGAAGETAVADATITMPSGESIHAPVRLSECLATAALESGPPFNGLRHCTHWVQKGRCLFGTACRFVHSTGAIPVVSAVMSPSADPTPSSSPAAWVDAPVAASSTASSPVAVAPLPPPPQAAATATTGGRRFPLQHRPYKPQPKGGSSDEEEEEEEEEEE